MATSERRLKLAVLIDADNMSADIADSLFLDIEKIGETIALRAYGDFSNGAKGWSPAISRYAIVPQQQFPNVSHKNASDIALVVDAMDLLHTGRFDGFCLVSSDSDFTRLATRIREHGLMVYGFGEQKTPDSFRRACLHFAVIGPASTDITNSKQPPPVTPKAAATPKPTTKPASQTTQEQKALSLLPAIRKAFDKTVGSDGWASLNQIGQETKKIAPNFSWKGFASLGALMQKTGAFVVEGTGPTRRARLLAPTVQIATTKATPPKKPA